MAHWSGLALSIVNLLCSFFMHVCRLVIISVGLVDEGGFAILYGIVWAMCIRGIGVMVELVVPSMSNVYAMDTYKL